MDYERKPLDEMSTEEKIDEILAIARALTDAIEEVTSNPMLAPFLGGK